MAHRDLFYEPPRGQKSGLPHDPFRASWSLVRFGGSAPLAIKGHDTCNLGPFSQFTNVSFDPHTKTREKKCVPLFQIKNKHISETLNQHLADQNWLCSTVSTQKEAKTTDHVDIFWITDPAGSLSVSETILISENWGSVRFKTRLSS